MSFFMQRLLACCFFTAFVFSGNLSAETDIDKAYLEKVAELREAALSNDLAYRLTESLTTEVGPRLGGSPGDAKAVKWAVAKFNELGFDKVYTQPVTFKRWIRGEESAEVLSPFSQELKITALGGTHPTPRKGLKGELVHFKTLQDLEAADRSEVEGKIVFISNRMTRSKNGSGYGKAVAARSRGSIVTAEKGGIGVIIRSIGTDPNRDPHTGYMKSGESDPHTGEYRYFEEDEMVPAGAVSNPDADLLMNMLKREQPIVVRYTLRSRWGGDYTSQNVIGEITGSKKPDEVVVIGGHLDSWDLGTGAIDDASGCAITMAAAKLIKDAGLKPERTIRVILWANEEYGLSGAKAYAESQKDNMKNHIIGAESDFGAGRIYAFATRISDDSLPFVNQMSQLMAPLGITYAGNKGYSAPDISPLKALGMATMGLYQDGTDYFDLHHTQDDTFDKVDPEAMAQNVAAWIVFVALAAQYPQDLGFDLK